MVIYEVNLQVDNSILQSYQSWLSQHLKEMLCIDGFLSAKVFTDKSAIETNSAFTHIVVHYTLESHEKLNNYFANEAKAMRRASVEKFGDKFKAERRVLQLDYSLVASDEIVVAES